MTDLDKLQARKIRQQIEIKQNNLRLFVPERNFLQFIGQLEQFQQIILGVDTDELEAQVQLPLVRTRFERLQENYKSLLNILTNKAERVKQLSSDLLLKDLFKAVTTSTLYLRTNFREFQSKIETSISHLYNLNAILIIHDLLSALQAEVKTVEKNFENISKSTTKRLVKHRFKRIFTTALAATIWKFANLARPFSKFVKPKDPRFKFRGVSINMSVNDTQQTKPLLKREAEDKTESIETKDKLDEQRLLAVEMTDPPNEKHFGNDASGEAILPESKMNHEAGEMITLKAKLLKKSNNLQNAYKFYSNKVPTEQTAEEVNELVSDKDKEEILNDDARQSAPETNIGVTASFTSFFHLKEELQNEMDRQKEQIHFSLLKLSKLENKIKELSKSEGLHRRKLKVDIEKIKKLLTRVSGDPNLLEAERVKTLQDYSIQMGQLAGLNEEILHELEAQKQNYKIQSLEIADRIYEIKKTLDAKMQQLIDDFKSSHLRTITEVEQLRIKRKLQAGDPMQEAELAIFSTMGEIENFQVDDNGVYYYDKAYIKKYLTASGLPKLHDKHAEVTLDETETKAEELSGAPANITMKSNAPTLGNYSRKASSRPRPINSAGSTRITDQDNRRQLQPDSETYIQNTLGKPLRQALAAVTIYQPSDPINYVAHYLLQYRYNELRNFQRQQEFDNLLMCKTLRKTCEAGKYTTRNPNYTAV